MIENRAALARSPAHELALDCVEAGIRAAHPERVVADAVSRDGDVLRVADSEYDLADYDEVVVLGGGKAAAQVAAVLEAVLGDRIAAGAVVTNDPAETDAVAVLPGDHPVPSEAGVASTRRVLELADRAGEDTLVLAAITGGGSALLAAPAGGLGLDDLRTTTDALLDSGASIHETNAVRKHLSAIKGGRLARRAAPATVGTLALSDVVGNDLDVVASGPTVPDTSTFADALAVLDRYDLASPESIPAPVRERLERGAAGDLPETPKPGDAVFDRTTARVLADGFAALAAGREVASERGYEPTILSSRVRGEARDVAPFHVAVAEECRATGNPVEPPAVVLSGGETTVTVRGDGRGGPNGEFALAAALELPEGVVLAGVDTDGIDGDSEAAGALVDSETVDSETVDDEAAARQALAENDTGTYLTARDALVRTGPTGTNVNDLRVMVVQSRE